MIDTVIGGPLTAAAIVVLGVGLLRTEGAALYAALPATIGVPFAISAIYGWHEHGRCTQLMSASDHEWALAYASHAEHLAGDGHCAEAWAFGAKVDAKDHEVYAHDFLERPAMVECRNAAREAADAKRLEDERRRAYHERQGRHDQAFDVARQARDAAKRAACDEARTLARQVEELDRQVYTAEVASNPDVAKCIASSSKPVQGDAAQ